MPGTRRGLLKRTGPTVIGLFGTTAYGTSSVGATDDEPDDGDDADSGRVRGTITHFGAPVADATVALSPGPGTETDEDGSYELEFESGAETDGGVELAVRADGYVDATRPIPAVGTGTRTVDVSLAREWGPGTGELQVYATPIGGGPTIPCRVTVYGDEEYDADAPEGSIPDGDAWRRGFRVSEGWWEVRVSDAAGYGDGATEVYVGDDERTVAHVELEEGDDEIPSTGRVRGTVVDERGEPVDDATVRIAGEPVSVDDGTFDVDIDHGRHPVVATADGYDTLRGSVLAKFGRTTELTVPLDPQ